MTIRDLQAKRDQLEKGDEVIIRRTAAPGGAQHIATVLETESKTVRVHVHQTGRIERIPYGRISPVVRATEQLPEPEGNRQYAGDWPVQAQDNLRRQAFSRMADGARANVATLIPVGEKTPPADDLTAWLDMGVQLMGQLQARKAALKRAEADALTQAQTLTEHATRCGVQAEDALKLADDFIRQGDEARAEAKAQNEKAKQAALEAEATEHKIDQLLKYQK